MRYHLGPNMLEETWLMTFTDFDLQARTFKFKLHGSLTGDDARSFLAKSQESAGITRRLIEETLSRTGDVGATVREVAGLFTAESKGYFLPQEIMETVIGQMTRFLASHRATTPL